MTKLTVAVLLLAILTSSVCSRNDLYNFDKDNEMQEFDQSALFDQTEHLNKRENIHQAQTFNQPEDVDSPERLVAENPDYLQKEEFDKDDDEISAIQGHVKYQDAAREALLQLAAKLRKGKNITNAFLKEIDGFEKGVAEIQSALGRRKIKPGQVSGIRDLIGKSVKNRKVNTNIVRALTSEGMFYSEKLDVQGRAVGKRQNVDLARGARDFLNSIKQEIGDVAFNEFLSINGEVTLIFALDTTGSMSGDIAAAIAISKQIVKQRSIPDVDYILSPFNDPTTGPITIKNETEGDDFITALEALRASGGGDCPELAFKGMIDALDSGPQPSSSMFVFTDASPKDATTMKKNEVSRMADDLEVKINFFIRQDTSCSLEPGALKPYTDLARETGGHFFTFKSSSDLIKLGKLVSNSLIGSARIGNGAGGAVSGKRELGTVRTYPISVDDSVESFSVIVSTQNSGANIRFVDPAGNIVTVGQVILLKGVIYNIDKAVTGVYKLILPADVGQHSYEVNAVSEINTDFGHYYVFVASRGSRIPVPMDQPLQGFLAKAFVNIAGADYVRPSSLKIKVVREGGAIHANVRLTAVGTSGARYFIRFKPPAGPFKLQLHGQTVKRNTFVRVSSRQDQSIPVLLKLSYREDSSILRRGQKTQITVVIRRGDVGASKESYTLTLKDERGYGNVARQPRPVRRGRQGFARIMFNVPPNAPAGKLEKVELSLKRNGKTTPDFSWSFSLLLL